MLDLILRAIARAFAWKFVNTVTRGVGRKSKPRKRQDY